MPGASLGGGLPSDAGAPAVVRVLAVCGSLRAGSSNGALLAAAALVAPPGVEVAFYDGLGALPPFNPDHDRALDDPGLPAAVRDLRERVAAADALVVSSPEYAHGVAGAFKNLLDWLVGGSEMPGRPVAQFHATGRAEHAPAHTAETLRTMSARLVDGAEVTVEVAGRPGAALAADSAAASVLRAGLAALASAARGADR